MKINPSFFIKMKFNRLLLTLLFALFLSCAWANGSLFYYTEFSESEGYFPGMPVKKDGWSVVKGVAEVMSGYDPSGSNSLVLLPFSVQSQISHMLEGGAGQKEELLYVDMFLRPMAGGSSQEGSQVGVGSARVSFVRDADRGRVYVWNETEEGEAEWIPTFYTILLNRQYHALEWSRLTLRVDRTLGLYDVYMNGTLVDYDVGLGANNRSAEEPYFNLGGTAFGMTWLGDYYAGSQNPLWDDGEGEGLPASWLAQKGIDPGGAGRYGEVDARGMLAVEAYFIEGKEAFERLDQERRERGEGNIPSRRKLQVFTPFE